MNNQREQNLMNRLRLEGKLELGEVVDFLNISESTLQSIPSYILELYFDCFYSILIIKIL